MQVIFSIAVAYYAAKVFGPDVNRWWYGPYYNQGDFFGYIMAFMPAVLVAGGILWPPVLKIWQDAVIAPLHEAKRRRNEKNDPLTRQSINQGTTIRYAGRVDRDFPYLDHGWKKKGRIQVTFNLERNTMAMQPRERQALILMNALERNGVLSSGLADDARFALAWGNGGCTLWGGEFTQDRGMMNQIGVKTGRDLIALEASHRSANVDAVISKLFDCLQRAARQPNASPELVKLLKRQTPPDDSED